MKSRQIKPFAIELNDFENLIATSWQESLNTSWNGFTEPALNVTQNILITHAILEV